MNRGVFDRLITVQRATMTIDDYGGEVQTWADLEQAYARVRFGRADEKRMAAQESGSQVATFEVLPTRALLGTQLTDRILFDEANPDEPKGWNITEVAPLDAQNLRFTAVRSR